MDKRKFLKLTGIIGAGALVAPLAACNDATPPPPPPPAHEPEKASAATVFELPALGFAFDALAPKIDAMTMEIHHGKHHAGYVRKLNAALETEASFNGMSLEEILANVSAEQTGVRNNGGGHYNHRMFWEILKPGSKTAPDGVLAEAITGNFGSFEEFSKQFFAAAKTRFGSGWAWLSVDANKKLFISSTPNQDNPLMTKIVEETGTPIMGIDVWEHAYYLNYQNKRGDYINSFMELINWDQVASNLSSALK
ncbi:MAG: superoxide dismutase [Flavobacteriales bacterium]